MLDAPLFLINGAMCAAAVMVAAFSRHDRRELVAIGLLICANFMFCNLAYTPYAPKYALAAIGFDVSSKELWMLADTLVSAGALILAWHRWWGWVIWVLAWVQIFAHALRMDKLVDEFLYTDVLQIVLLIQLAVLFVIGGPGLVEFLHRSIARFRSRSRRRAEAFVEGEGGKVP